MIGFGGRMGYQKAQGTSTRLRASKSRTCATNYIGKPHNTYVQLSHTITSPVCSTGAPPLRCKAEVKPHEGNPSWQVRLLLQNSHVISQLTDLPETFFTKGQRWLTTLNGDGLHICYNHQNKTRAVQYAYPQPYQDVV